jgi:hypothetical protein
MLVKQTENRATKNTEKKDRRYGIRRRRRSRRHGYNYAQTKNYR